MSTVVLNPLRIVADIWRHRYLLGQLIKRDVLLRYRGAMFGVLWIFLSPLLMLAIFAFIFGQVFQTRWPQQDSGLPFWLLLYSGLITFNIFAETVSRAPASVRGYTFTGQAPGIDFPSPAVMKYTQETAELREEIIAMRNEVARMKGAVSWIITKPLRAVRNVLRSVLPRAPEKPGRGRGK
jgi:hypothetical protein